MIISFSGLDGSGKTTHADLSEAHLRILGLECRRRHAIKGSLAYFFTHSVVGKVSSKAKESAESGLREKKGLKFSALSFIKKTLLLADIFYFNLRYGAYKNRKGKALISDRYFYDELVQLKYLGLAGRRYLEFYSSLIIPPDVAFYLRAEPSEAFARKREYDERYFGSKNVLYDGLKNETGTIIEVPSGTIKYRQGIIAGHIDGCIKENK